MSKEKYNSLRKSKTISLITHFIPTLLLHVVFCCVFLILREKMCINEHKHQGLSWDYGRISCEASGRFWTDCMCLHNTSGPVACNALLCQRDTVCDDFFNFTLLA